MDGEAAGRVYQTTQGRMSHNNQGEVRRHRLTQSSKNFNLCQYARYHVHVQCSFLLSFSRVYVNFYYCRINTLSSNAKFQGQKLQMTCFTDIYRILINSATEKLSVIFEKGRYSRINSTIMSTH
uniref:(northern house mosquito) hypothetical protein n=1 Tax=Culex pipiens TaxID=7175 RepID=A0A8D8GWI3_CULPI